MKPRLRYVGAPAGTMTGSSDITLHRLRIPELRLVRIEAGGSASLTLVEQIPALVQDHVDLAQPLPVRVRGFPLRFLMPDLVLLIGQLIDLVKQRFVVHDLPPLECGS